MKKIKFEKIDHNMNFLNQRTSETEIMKVLSSIPINEMILFKSLAKNYVHKLEIANRNIYTFYEYLGQNFNQLIISDLNNYVDDAYIRKEKLGSINLHSEKNNKDMYVDVYGSIDNLLGTNKGQ